MKVTFQDFYGQHVTVHNETGTGNLRLNVRTMPNLNDIYGKKPEECTLETDIALDPNLADILIGALSRMREGME